MTKDIRSKVRNIRVLELFAGIGACSKALERLGIDHEIVDAVEIDKFAIQSFNTIHRTNFEPQDITKWDKDIEVDLIMHGSPCQDFSVAGKGAGGDEGSGTRSSLLYESLRIIQKLKPKYVIWENVKNVLSVKHRNVLLDYFNKMEDAGYHSWFEVLNAKDFGVPQNRERMFMVSIRKDIIKDGEFIFPGIIPLEKKLKDVLEDKVDEKYYLSEKQMDGLLSSNYDQNKRFYDVGGVSPTISTMGGGQRQPKIIQRPRGKNKGWEHEISPTVSSSKWQDNNLLKEPLAVASRGRYGENGDGVDLVYPESKTRRGRVGHGVSKTIPASDSQGVLDGFRIRKLTPIECWRLMGFDDEDFRKAEKVNSNTQLYKQAGNSIVVNVLEAILTNLLEGVE